jgi:hypothetical protein
VKFKPHKWQMSAVKHAYDFLTTSMMGAKQLYAAPTGVGKSVVQLLVHQLLQDSWLITPTNEIIDGMLDKLQLDPTAVDSLNYRIATPVTLRNRLMDGRIRHPKQLIFDETHHQEANVWQELELLSGIPPCVGYTASPYRGTPKSTRAFRERWGEPLWLITYEEAIQMGYIKFPRMEILPLVDDDIVEVSGGEFDVTSLEAQTIDRLGDLADNMAQYVTDGKWDMATMFSMPSTEACIQFKMRCDERNIPVEIVNASTKNRREIFDRVERCETALLHINIVTEGVDLRIRRLVDVAPTLSPVRWVQQIGRIMRPWDNIPHYICTNRNVIRHSYILDGVVPMSAVVESEKKFGPTQRAHTRVLGMEALGRFKPTTADMLNGSKVYIYAMSALIANVVVEYCCLVPPHRDAIWAYKVNTKNEDGTRNWGKWVACEAPESIQGFASKGNKEPSEKQHKWWLRSAAGKGLDPNQEVTRKSFCALPVLMDIGENLNV